MATNLESLKRNRTAQRTAFSKTINALNVELAKVEPNETFCEATVNVLSERITELDTLNDQILKALLEKKESDEELAKELENAEEYKTKLEIVKVRIQRLIMPAQQQTIPCISPAVENARQDNSVQLKLPKIQLRKFNEDQICGNLPAVSTGEWLQSLHKQGIYVNDDSSKTISLLIGADIAGRLYTGNVHQTKQGPTALETKLGWVFLGKENESNQVKRKDATLTVFTMFTANAKISDLWELDVLGIRDPTATLSKEVHQAQVVEQFRESITFNEEGRYEVHLPWKENHPPLGNNRSSAEKRLIGLTNKLKSEHLYDAYDEVFDSWLKAGIIEEVRCINNKTTGYYLPHRHVVKENSTTRIRPVFDASANSKDGPSLNQCLDTGPNLIELITSILLKFMENKIGVASDICKAFLQISVTPMDRNVLKFLWWNKTEPREMIEYRHRRVVFGVNSSPFLLGATITYHLDVSLQKVRSPEEANIIRKLKTSFYVDNCIASVKSADEELRFREVSTDIMRRANFVLRGWEQSYVYEEENTSLILGIVWDKREDCLLLNICFADELKQPLTKRKILSTAHRVFDPLGWACPTLLLPRLMLQQLWSKNLGWDTEIPEDVAVEFSRWYAQIALLRQLKVPRWIFGEVEDARELHMFVDASKYAYAAALFIRIEKPQGKVKVHLVQAKARVAPTGEVSIPRMELLAAMLGARLMRTVQQTMDLFGVKVFYWSDSTTALSWITQCKQWSRFVWNRVMEIREITDIASWRHIHGSMNPADLPSRGCSTSQLIDSQWWKGPAWLKLSSSEWPCEIFETNEELVNAELSKSGHKTLKGNESSNPVDATCTNIATTSEECSWYMKRFSDYNKIIRMIAWILRFAHNSRTNNEDRKIGDIQVEEYNHAEEIMYRLAQNESNLGTTDQRLKGLNVYEDEHGIIRSKSLICNRDDHFGFRFPVILDFKHPLTRLIIEHTHVRMKHAGINTTISALREKVWIISSRRAVRSVIQKCVTCRRYAAKTLQTPPASLPRNRVRDAAVFEVIGVDYAGPLYLKDGKKAWVCLYTCAVYRAIHLELVTTLTTDGFFETLRRFIARRGRPHTIYADNGTNFSGAHNMLGKINWEKFISMCAVERIEWKFNPPSAPWWGGWWERLIRIVRDLLKKTLKRTCVSYEEMTTILCEGESIVNARPISYNVDNEELVAITPEMFLKEIRNDGAPDLDHLEDIALDRHMKYRQRLRKELRRRFRDEYLGQLSRYTKSKDLFTTVNTGDIVLIANDNQKRVYWPLARVMAVIPGNDGLSRIARLKASNGELVRPLQRLILLEGSPRLTKEVTEADVACKILTSASDAALDGRENAIPEEHSHVEATNDDKILEEDATPVQSGKTRGGRTVKIPKRFV